MPRKIRSMNKLKSGIALHGDKVAWEKALAAVGAPEIDPSDLELVEAYAAFVHPAAGRRRLSIERQAPSEHYFLDATNCSGGAKKLEDVLVSAGYFVDDKMKWLDGPHIIQTVSPEKKFYTIVRITDALPWVPDKASA